MIPQLSVPPGVTGCAAVCPVPAPPPLPGFPPPGLPGAVVVAGGVVLDALIEVTVAVPECGAAESCLSAVHAVTISTGATTPSTSPVPTRHRRPLPNICMIRTVSPPAPAA
ncbi:hypothetical protein [Nocardia nepalensis]|uniref:hypothetical protein n=1 Tax=Nocardia nepalensis TaxID=3375448 RepID=UPI003B683F65